MIMHFEVHIFFRSDQIMSNKLSRATFMLVSKKTLERFHEIFLKAYFSLPMVGRGEMFEIEIFFSLKYENADWLICEYVFTS